MIFPVNQKTAEMRFRALQRVTVLLLLSLFLPSCTIGDDGRFRQPRFAKEWEVKEIVPGAKHSVLDITANKYGVFALVEACESELIRPKEWSEQTDEDREEVIKGLKWFTGKEKVDENDFNRCRETLNKNVIRYTYQIQHFDTNGNFLKSWPNNNKLNYQDIKRHTLEIPMHFKEWLEVYHDIDSRTRFIKPIRMISDDEGRIFVADVEGNKLVSFNHDGLILNIVRISKKRSLSHEWQAACKGLTRADKDLKLVYQPDIASGWFNMATYDTVDGSTRSDRGYPLPKVRPFISPPIARMLDMKLPLLKMHALIDDIAVDNKGNYYVLAGMQSVVKYDRSFIEVKAFDVVLKEGFDTDVEYVHHMTGEKKKYGQDVISMLGGFDSQLGASFGQEMGGPGYYDLDRIYITPEDRLMVTFRGNKPFGVMVAVVYDLEGKQLGYWKADNKTGLEWFNEYAPIMKIEAAERNCCLAFAPDTVYVGKSIHTHGLIQKYTSN